MKLTRVYEFSASHRLTRMPEGHRCSELHGHNYRLEITVAADSLINGMIIDTGELDVWVHPVIRRLDHRNLNDLGHLGLNAPVFSAQPTIENIASYFVEALQFVKNSGKGINGIRVVRVKLSETERSWVEVELE